MNPFLRLEPRRLASLGLVLAAAVALAALTGCGIAPATNTNTGSITALGGRAMGGQQPIVGATVQLFAPGITGYGSAPTLLATAPTLAGGNFTLPAYNCPTTDTVTLLVVKGGDAGSGVNNLIGEATLLPRCSQLTPSTFVVVSEATTVAAAYALAPFAGITATATNYGTSPTNIAGLNNAAGAVNNLVNFSTGNPRNTSELTGIVAPTRYIGTIADILASCVNSSGSLAAGTNCNTLITNTTVNSVAPTDTLQAAFNIALNPGANVAALFPLASSTPPFAGLTYAPNDFSLTLAYGNYGIANATTGIAIDAAGDAWVSTEEFNNTTHVLTEISPAGQYLSGTTGFGSAYINGPEAVSINSTGNVYVACAGGNNLVKFNSNGSYNSTITAASFHNPNGASVGGNDNIWVSSFNGTAFTKILDSTQAEDTVNGPFASGTEGVEVVNSGTAVWVANYQSDSITRLEYGTFNKANYTTSSTPSGLAIDAANNVWVGLAAGVAEFSDSGALLSPAAGYKTNTAFVPQSIVVDGLGRVFFSAGLGSQTGPGSLFEFSAAGANLGPDNGYRGTLNIPVKPAVPGGIAIDGSGNVWITGDANGTTFTNYVTEVVGIAAPVVTPRSAATTNLTIAQRP